MILVPPFARHKIQPRPTHSSILKITKLPNNLRPGVCKFNNKNYTELSRADRKLPKKIAENRIDQEVWEAAAAGVVD